MRFIFSKTSMTIIAIIFIGLTIFTYVMMVDGSGTKTFDATNQEPSTIMQANLTDYNLVTVPRAEFQFWTYSFSEGEFKSQSWVIWPQTTLEIKKLDINLNLFSLFPDMADGYTNMSNKLDSAPWLFRAVIVIIPIIIVLIVLQAIEVSI